MREKAKKTIEKFDMFPPQTKIIVGLSGGADSVALLHLLSRLRAEFDWSLTAVHIHHGLRGDDADADARFAAKFCDTLGVPCIVRRYDVRAEAKKRGLGEEETGRILRYAAFREAAGADGRIAVAHHQRDQAETVLMRLCRGTGLQGLTAMLPVRGNICRPLLECSREEIERYCRENGLSWQEDASNREERYTRNKLRLQVLPVLEEINPRAAAHIAQTAALLAVEEDFLQEQTEQSFAAAVLPAAEGTLALSSEKLRQLHPAMRRRVLRKALAAFLPQDISQVQIAALEELLQKETGKSRNFAGNLYAQNSYGTLLLSRKKEQSDFSYVLSIGEELRIPEAGISVLTWIGEKNIEISQDDCTKIFDYDKINQTIFCRTRQTGDFIRLKNGRKKIKELFIDEKIPREEREHYPLFAVGEEVLWIPGLRVSAAYQTDEQTVRYFYIQIRREQA